MLAAALARRASVGAADEWDAGCDPVHGHGDVEHSVRFLHMRLGVRSMDTFTHYDPVDQLVAVVRFASPTWAVYEL
jgi:hypothetical protein